MIANTIGTLSKLNRQVKNTVPTIDVYSGTFYQVPFERATFDISLTNLIDDIQLTYFKSADYGSTGVNYILYSPDLKYVYLINNTHVIQADNSNNKGPLASVYGDSVKFKVIKSWNIVGEAIGSHCQYGGTACITSDGRYLYVPTYNPSSAPGSRAGINIIDTVTNTQNSLAQGYRNFSTFLSKDEKFLFVSDQGLNGLYAFDISTDKMNPRYLTGGSLYDPNITNNNTNSGIISPDNKNIYVSSNTLGVFKVPLSTYNNSVEFKQPIIRYTAVNGDNISNGNPEGLSISPDGNILYIPNYSVTNDSKKHLVHVFNLSSNTITGYYSSSDIPTSQQKPRNSFLDPTYTYYYDYSFPLTNSPYVLVRPISDFGNVRAVPVCFDGAGTNYTRTIGIPPIVPASATNLNLTYNRSTKSLTATWVGSPYSGFTAPYNYSQTAQYTLNLTSPIQTLTTTTTATTAFFSNVSSDNVFKASLFSFNSVGKSSNYYQFFSTASYTITAFVLGGGGSGGDQPSSANSGGGGGGAAVAATAFLTSGLTYNVTVGKGGVAGASYGGVEDGGYSAFSNFYYLSADGGGAGGSNTTPAHSKGTGGGAAGTYEDGTSNPGGYGIAPFGSNGGSSTIHSAGGGGSAQNATGGIQYNANGGDGTAYVGGQGAHGNNAFLIDALRGGTKLLDLGQDFYGGGGGGGDYNPLNSGYGAWGGNGGGGSGGYGIYNLGSSAGVNGKGGGGGAGHNGGHGVVKLFIPTKYYSGKTTGSPTVTTTTFSSDPIIVLTYNYPGGTYTA
jgi:hypothetical protein